MLTKQITKHLPYPPAMLYGLVADVESYPEFLPWCLEVKVLTRSQNGFRARVKVGNRLISEEFVSSDTLKPPTASDPTAHIRATSTSPPFKAMDNSWWFYPEGDGTRVEFSIRLEFTSRLKEQLLGGFFSEAVAKMVTAFEARAESLHKEEKN